MKPRTFSLILSGPGRGRLRDKDSLALEIFSVRLRFSLNKLRLGAEILDLMLLTLFFTYFLRLLEADGELLISSVISVDYSEPDMCVDCHLWLD